MATGILLAITLLQACSFTPTEKSQIVNSFTSPFVEAGQVLMGNAGSHTAQTMS
ncbi:hypothetical protein [Piscirickettsia litoralis]|uniref:hypothetical protein n=1 Tax=Piscirickettsia litoralis TaxID=1891921 RepID=UPI0013016515|nr:hypothetical protein [Piscirickettsia litoralis]